MKKFTELLKNNLKLYPRNRGIMFGTILFPLIFIGVFGLVMNQSFEGNQTIHIGIVTMDEGIPDQTIVYGAEGKQVERLYFQNDFTQMLENLTYEDNETDIFDVTYFNVGDEDNALKELQKGEIKALLYIPNDFSIGVMAAFRNKFENNDTVTIATNNWENYPENSYTTEIVIQGDKTMQAFGTTSSILDNVLDSYFNMGQNSTYGHNTIINSNIDTKQLTPFDYILPGLVIFGVMQNLATVAHLSLKDVEDGIVRRLKITKISGKDYTAAIIVSQLIVSMLQIPIFFIVAIMFGFPSSIDILYAFIFAILICLSMTGIGITLSSLVESTDSVGQIATMISIPMAFLSGAFFEIPEGFLGNITLFGNEFGILDFLPPSPAIEALRLILIGGRGINEVIPQLLMLSFITMILLFTGIVMYSKKHLTPEK